MQILYVDDDAEFGREVSTVIERLDDRMTVETRTTPDGALDRIRERGTDCVVSEYDLHDQTGIEFLKTVRPEFPDLPFILYTGTGSEDVASEAIAAGVTDYLQKEASSSQYEVLANRIRNAVESHRATERAEHTAEWARTLLEYSSDYVFVVDETGQISYISPSVTRVLGYMPEELTGTLAFDFVHPADIDEAIEALSEILDRPNEDVTAEFRAEHADGSHRWLEVRGRNLIDDPVIGGVLVNVRDITDRKEGREKLQYRTKQLQDIIDTVEGAMWIRNAENEYVFMNQFHRDLFDIGADVDVAGMQFADLLPADVATQFRENDNRVYETGEAVEIEETVMTEHGPRDFLTRIAPLYEDGTVYATCGIATDITEQKTRERQLEQFTSIVSHDLRNPLNVAMGHLELAAAECDCTHLEHVQRAHTRMAALIDDLLALARAGTVIAETTTVDLESMVMGCWTSVATGSATLVVDIERAVQADESRLRQVFENLFRNAIEHGGEAVTVTIGALSDGFYIEDNGPGIPPDAREDIFEAGYSTSEDGTGFGLSIVKEIVEAHDWRIRVTQGAAGGTRFEITGVEFAAE